MKRYIKDVQEKVLNSSNGKTIICQYLSRKTASIFCKYGLLV